jgi:hypothetical protein
VNADNERVDAKQLNEVKTGRPVTYVDKEAVLFPVFPAQAGI